MFHVRSFYTDTLSTSVRYITPQPPPPPPHKTASFRVYDISVLKLQLSDGCSDILLVYDDKGSAYQNMSLVNDL